jgi:hypothetical protein
MMKNCRSYLVLFSIVLLLSNMVIAQSSAKPAVKPMVKYKPPVVQCMLGNAFGSEAAAGVEEAKNLISLPLKIADSKNVNYTLSSYHFAYKRTGITEDEATGKTSPETDMVSRQFNVTPLPALWQTNISESLHKGETLHFFDIIVLDKQGRRFFAPELKISIQ